MPLEPAHRPLPGLRQMVADAGGLYLANALIGFIFAASGPVAIILAVGARGGLSEADLSSWIFGSFFINGLITLLFCTLYRQPLVFFWTIPGTVLVGPALGHLRWAEVVGVRRPSQSEAQRCRQALETPECPSGREADGRELCIAVHRCR